ncbi:MAG TPA: SET domain-containing protein-lysine N-methyltransferase [Opitutales bacterium]|nr:SET domain-containing protein-lysine N-methyltransferase [Opitutales bacterium]
MTPPAFFVQDSPIDGHGLFAARALAEGETVAEYVGERIGKAESARRQAAADKVYIFDLDENFDLDGDLPGNPARRVNHSCEPNCEAVAEGESIRVRALRAIGAGEELTFDYGYSLAVFPGHRCRCGAPSCAGFIVARSERRRVRRLLNRPGRSLRPGPKTREEVGA